MGAINVFNLLVHRKGKNMTTTLLSSIAGVLISLLVAYVPGLDTWYQTLDGVKKRRWMGFFLVITGLGIFFLACLDLVSTWGITLTCNVSGALELVGILVTLLISNQSTYLLLTPSSR